MLDSSTQAVLRQILDISLSIQSTTEAPVPEAKITPSNPSSLSFPPLPSVLNELRSIGIVDQVATKMADIFHTRCLQLQKLHCQNFFESQSISSPAVHDLLHNYFVKAYTESVTQLRSKLIHFVNIHQEKLRIPLTTTPPVRSSKTAFNHDYVPFLEKYFEYNAYPSVADRALMARKSMMTERQIEVWFQNHRNRARKEGRTLSRLRHSDPLPSNLSFGTLDEKMGDFIRAESERSIFTNTDESDSDSDAALEAKDVELSAVPPVASAAQPITNTATNPLNPPAPSHVHRRSPTFLQAISQTSPFHLSFPCPTWPRPQPTTPRSAGIRLTASDIDELTDRFSRLTVREVSLKQGRRKMAPLPRHARSSMQPISQAIEPEMSINAATCYTTTILCPRRHPAFVPVTVSLKPTLVRRRTPSSGTRSSPMRPSGAIQRTSCTAMYASSSLVDPFSSQPPHPSTLSPYPSFPPAPRRQKKSPQLPRRVPGSSPTVHPLYDGPPPTLSRASSSASLSSVTSSPGSIYSSSASDTSSSAPVTPEHETLTLPASLSYPYNNSSVTINIHPITSNNPNSTYTKSYVPSMTSQIADDLCIPPRGASFFPQAAHANSFQL